MSRDLWRLALLGAAGAVFVWLGHDRPKQPDAAGPAMRAYLDAPDMGLHCFDDHGQPVGWQWVNPDDAQRSCGVSRERLMELRSTDWRAVAAAKDREQTTIAFIGGGLAWLALGVWLLRIERGSSAVMARMSGRNGYWIRRRNADRVWLAAWLLAIPGVFLLPQLPRDTLISIVGVGGLLWLVVVLPVKGVYLWLQSRKDEQEEKLASAMRRDKRQHLGTARAVKTASEEERLGL